MIERSTEPTPEDPHDRTLHGLGATTLDDAIVSRREIAVLYLSLGPSALKGIAESQ